MHPPPPPPVSLHHLPSPFNILESSWDTTKKNGRFPYYHLTVEIKYARKVVYILISAEFIITVLIDGDEYIPSPSGEKHQAVQSSWREQNALSRAPLFSSWN